MISSFITVIIPCKDEENYIGDTLLSLNKQKNIEGTKVIILDGDSTDNTIDIINNIIIIAIINTVLLSASVSGGDSGAVGSDSGGGDSGGGDTVGGGDAGAGGDTVGGGDAGAGGE